MPASIKNSEIKWLDPVQVRFGFSGLTTTHAIPIIRDIVKDEWPKDKRPDQCVYVIRLRGKIAVSYNNKYSPVIYIGEGSAYKRLYSHASWIASLLVSAPNVEIEVHIAEVTRRNHDSLYQYIEADMLRWFNEDYGTLPWFNRQRERSKEAQYKYDKDVEQLLRRHLGVGTGNKFLWAIKPLENNDQFDSYYKGKEVEEGRT